MGDIACFSQLGIVQRLDDLAGIAAVDSDVQRQQTAVKRHFARDDMQAGLGIQTLDMRKFPAELLVVLGALWLDGGYLGRQGNTYPAQQGFVEFLWINRLGDVVVHACPQAGIAVFVEGVGSHRQDGGGRTLRQVTDGVCGLDAVHVRHLDIHQDQVVVVGGCELNCLSAIFGNIDPQPDVLE